MIKLPFSIIKLQKLNFINTHMYVNDFLKLNPFIRDLQNMDTQYKRMLYRLYFLTCKSYTQNWFKIILKYKNFDKIINFDKKIIKYEKFTFINFIRISGGALNIQAF